MSLAVGCRSSCKPAYHAAIVLHSQVESMPEHMSQKETARYGAAAWAGVPRYEPSCQKAFRSRRFGPATHIIDRMYPNRVALPDDLKRQVAQVLQRQLASAIDLQSQAKFAHWNVKELNFYQVHLAFNKVAKTIRKQIDLLAERITSLGGIANGTIRQAICLSPVTEYPVETTAGMDHVRALAQGLNHYCQEMREASAEIEDLGDASTSDFLNALIVDAEERLYFLESHLQAGKLQ